MKRVIKGVTGTIGAISAAGAGMVYTSYKNTFTVSKKRLNDPHRLPKGEQYEAVSEQTHALIDGALSLPYEDVWIQSEDGLRLHGKYYEVMPGAPVEILIHGYRSIPIRDFCGGLQLALQMGHNVLLIDQRAHGESEGKCLTFGILERKDCKCWAEYIQKRCGEDVPIILVGISMGASTVLMAADSDLPENVVGIIADSGYTSPREIIRKVIRGRKMNVTMTWPLVAAAAKLYGGFDLQKCSAKEVMKNCKIPVLFIHGEDDHFVPCRMTRENYLACAAPKSLLIVKGAGHGLGYMVDREAYVNAIREFTKMILNQ